MDRRTFLRSLVAGSVLLAVPALAQAAEPNRIEITSNQILFCDRSGIASVRCDGIFIRVKNPRDWKIVGNTSTLFGGA